MASDDLRINPYGALCASMTYNDWVNLLASSSKLRIKKCGFTITNIQPNTDELGNIRGNVTEVSTISNAPFLYVIKDPTEYSQADGTTSMAYYQTQK